MSLEVSTQTHQLSVILLPFSVLPAGILKEHSYVSQLHVVLEHIWGQ